MNNYANIPQEMRPYNQWIVWRYEGNDRIKTPYNAVTGGLASVTDPNSWTDFNTAIAASDNYSGPGFVYTQHDPYAIIDLDKTNDPDVLANQMRWYEQFPTYAERSPSGFGAHIICKAVVGGGRRDTRKAIEIYDRLRYVTFTGNVLRNIPIVDCQPQVDALLASLGGWQTGGPITVHEQPAHEPDAMVITKAMQAANGAKFSDLFNGNWQRWYPSQSEADFALVDELQFWTKNVEQIERIFYLSALGQRDKALKRPKYIRDMVVRSFDRTPRPVDMTALNAGWETVRAQTQTATLGGGLNAGSAAVAGYAPTGFVSEQPPAPLAQVNGHVNHALTPANSYTFPPGMLGELARHFYNNSPRPVVEIAVATALGFAGGVMGRSFQSPTGLALNLYINLIADTGTGKDSMRSNLNALFKTVARMSSGNNTATLPAIYQFQGPSYISSDTAIHRELELKPSIYTFLPEFGLLLQQLTSANATSPQKSFGRKLLSLYTSADRGNTEGAMVYADRKNNAAPIDRPCLTVLAETTPETYYKALGLPLLTQGLVPRFLAIEYTGPRPGLNEYRCDLPASLVQWCQDIVTRCIALNHGGNYVQFEFSPQADKEQRDFEKFVTDHINSKREDVFKRIWNRAHSKAIKVAGAIDMANNFQRPTPIVDLTAWEWARDRVIADVTNTVAKFESGEVGISVDGGDENQNKDIREFIRDYMTKPWSELHNMVKVKEGELMHTMRVIPYSYFSARAERRASFRNAYNRKRALDDALSIFVAQGVLREYRNAYHFKMTNGQAPLTSDGRVYIVVDPTSFLN